MTDEDFLSAFETTQLCEKDFDHAAHVRAAFLLIQRHGFAHAVPAYCIALQALTRRFGVPEKYHETITIAFLALINERLVSTPDTDWDSFCAPNADLFSGNALLAYYTPAQLAQPAARRTFQLPHRQTANCESPA